MRTIFILLCIFGVTLSAKAQMFGKKWQQGSYYDTLGHKTAGLIAWSHPEKFSKDTGDHIFYKADNKGTKTQIETNLISSFTMGEDSFTVSHNKALYFAPVLKVLLNGNIKLYYWQAEVVNWKMAALGSLGAVGGALAGATTGAAAGAMAVPSTAAYFYGTDCNSLRLVTRKNFVEVMSRLLNDKPDAVAKITDKTFKMGDMDDLLNYYKTGKMPPKPYNPYDYN